MRGSEEFPTRGRRLHRRAALLLLLGVSVIMHEHARVNPELPLVDRPTLRVVVDAPEAPTMRVSWAGVLPRPGRGSGSPAAMPGESGASSGPVEVDAYEVQVACSSSRRRPPIVRVVTRGADDVVRCAATFHGLVPGCQYTAKVRWLRAVGVAVPAPSVPAPIGEGPLAGKDAGEAPRRSDSEASEWCDARGDGRIPAPPRLAMMLPAWTYAARGTAATLRIHTLPPASSDVEEDEEDATGLTYEWRCDGEVMEGEVSDCLVVQNVGITGRLGTYACRVAVASMPGMAVDTRTRLALLDNRGNEEWSDTELGGWSGTSTPRVSVSSARAGVLGSPKRTPDRHPASRLTHKDTSEELFGGDIASQTLHRQIGRRRSSGLSTRGASPSNGRPPAFDLVPAPMLDVSAEASVTLVSRANAAPEPTYRWLRDGVRLNASSHGLSGVDTSTLILAVPIAGIYTCVAENAFGQAESGACSVYVVHQPQTGEQDMAQRGFPRSVAVGSAYGEGAALGGDIGANEPARHTKIMIEALNDHEVKAPTPKELKEEEKEEASREVMFGQQVVRNPDDDPTMARSLESASTETAVETETSRTVARANDDDINPPAVLRVEPGSHALEANLPVHGDRSPAPGCGSSPHARRPTIAAAAPKDRTTKPTGTVASAPRTVASNYHPPRTVGAAIRRLSAKHQERTVRARRWESDPPALVFVSTQGGGVAVSLQGVKTAKSIRLSTVNPTSSFREAKNRHGLVGRPRTAHPTVGRASVLSSGTTKTTVAASGTDDASLQMTSPSPSVPDSNVRRRPMTAGPHRPTNTLGADDGPPPPPFSPESPASAPTSLRGVQTDEVRTREDSSAEMVNIKSVGMFHKGSRVGTSGRAKANGKIKARSKKIIKRRSTVESGSKGGPAGIISEQPGEDGPSSGRSPPAEALLAMDGWGDDDEEAPDGESRRIGTWSPTSTVPPSPEPPPVVAPLYAPRRSSSARQPRSLSSSVPTSQSAVHHISDRFGTRSRSPIRRGTMARLLTTTPGTNPPNPAGPIPKRHASSSYGRERPMSPAAVAFSRGWRYGSEVCRGAPPQASRRRPQIPHPPSQSSLDPSVLTGRPLSARGASTVHPTEEPRRMDYVPEDSRRSADSPATNNGTRHETGSSRGGMGSNAVNPRGMVSGGGVARPLSGVSKVPGRCGTQETQQSWGLLRPSSAPLRSRTKPSLEFSVHGSGYSGGYY